MRALFKCEEDYYQPIKTKEVEAFKEGYCKFERNGDRCKTGSLPDYLRDTYLHLSSPINNFNDSKDGSKINLSLQIMFRNPQYITKELSMYLKIGNITVFLALKQRNWFQIFSHQVLQNIKIIYQKRLKVVVLWSHIYDFTLYRLYFSCHTTTLNCGGGGS